MSTNYHHQHGSLNLVGVLSETKRIINAHSRHFLALSVLFLLPLSFSFILVYPLALSLSNPPSSNSILSIFQYRHSLFFISTPQNDGNNDPQNLVVFPILFGVSVALLSLCATASITYSTFHGFYGRPVRFISSIKSIILYFLPLVATLIVTHLILGLIVLVVFGGFVLITGMDLAALDFNDINRNSNVYSLGFVCAIGVFVLCVLVFLQVEWCLSSVVVVVEGRWGFAALRRSSYLLGGMRGIALSMIVLFGVLVGVLGVLCSSLMPGFGSGGISEGWVSWAFVFQTVVYTGFMMILMLYSMAGSAVLFMYCKALQGELALEIAEEFAQEYVSLPFDGGKVPHVVYVV